MVKKGLRTNPKPNSTPNNDAKAIHPKVKMVESKSTAKIYTNRVKAKTQANQPKSQTNKTQAKITGNTKATKLKSNKIRLTVKQIQKAFEFIKSKVGTPQGGVISPLLSNIALHHIDVFFSTNLKNLYYQRFADDLLIMHDNLEVLGAVKPKMVELLAIAGLKINATKTSIQAIRPQKSEDNEDSAYKSRFSSLGYDYYLGSDKIRVTPSLESQNKLVENITLI